MSSNDSTMGGHGRDQTNLAALDGLRGFLAFWVFAGHAAAYCGASLPIIGKQVYAVDVFMFVSGFLMAYHFRLRQSREPWQSPATWIQFYIRRFFRIAPAYYLLLAIALAGRSIFYSAYLTLLTQFPPSWLATLHLPASLPALTLQDLLAHLTFTFGFFPQYAQSNALPDWSIGLEMQFYLAFPFIMLLYLRAGYLKATMVCLSLWLLSNALFGVYAGNAPKLLGHFPQPTFLPLKLNCFIVGILVSEALQLRPSDLTKATVLLLGAFAVTIKGSSWYFQAACLIFCVLSVRGEPVAEKSGPIAFVNRILATRLVSFLAETSYGVYLLHNLVLLPWAAFLAGQPSYLHLVAVVRFAVLLASSAALTYPLAFLLFRYVETPGIALGREALCSFRRRMERLLIKKTTSPTVLADSP